MRLYLSSFRNGNKPEKLLELLGSSRRTALILNAQDWKSEEERAVDIAQESQRLKSISLEPVEVDLRKYFGKPEHLKEVISKFDLVWVRGGNSFVLRRAFKQSGADVIIPELLKNDAIVYGGYSAGIDVIQPHLHGIELVDNPDLVPDGYNKEIIWEGLAIIPYCVASHYKSDHPESADVDKTVAFYIDNHIPFIALRDGQVIVIENDKQMVVG